MYTGSERRPQALPNGQLLGGTLLEQINLGMHVHIFSSTGVEVDLARPSPLGLVDYLVTKVDEREDRQEDVGIDKVASVEGRECGPSLNKREEDIGAEAKVCVPGIPKRLERQLVRRATLGRPCRAKANVRERDGPPYQEG